MSAESEVPERAVRSTAALVTVTPTSEAVPDTNHPVLDHNVGEQIKGRRNHLGLDITNWNGG